MARSPKRRVSPKALTILVVVALCWYGIDQLTKFLVVTHLPYEQTVPVFGRLLQFFYIKNSGAAFSIGTGSTWIFSIIGVAVLCFIVWYAPRIRSTAWAVLFGLLLGGLVGNLSDRLFREPGFGVGHVVDFIKIPLLPAYFNIADVGITSSMVLFLILTLRGVGLDGRRPLEESAADTTQTPDAARPADVGQPADAARPADDAAGGERRDGGPDDEGKRPEHPAAT